MVAAVTVGSAVTPTATGAVTPTATGVTNITATAIATATAVSPASAAYASPDQSLLAALANATRATVNLVVTDLGSVKTKLDAAVVDISAVDTKLSAAVVDITALTTQVNAAIVDIKALRANAATALASIHGGATEAGVSVSTYITATMAAKASSLISVRSAAGGVTGVLKLVRDPNHTLVTGEVFWDGMTGLKFCAADTITSVDLIYSKADSSQKVSCLMPTVSP